VIGTGKGLAFIDLWRGTPFSLAWLVAEGNLSEGGPKYKPCELVIFF
jgi:hypothetical protein